MEDRKWEMENSENGKNRFSLPFVYFLSIFNRSSFSVFYFPFPISIRFPFSIFLCLFLCACSQLEKPKPAPFYSDAAPVAAVKEFRWSNGGRFPESFDPARAAAPPETDVARAVYEGLTDTDARTLKIVPAIAVDWTASDDDRTWTFKLRGNAVWSNGERITAQDFVRSWKRAAALGSDEGRVPHFRLLSNIVGVRRAAGKAEETAIDRQPEIDSPAQKDLNRKFPPVFNRNDETNKRRDVADETQSTEAPENSTNEPKPGENAKGVEPNQKKQSRLEAAFGAVAVDDFTLKVSLLKPDKDFPALVAHPLFRPVYAADGKALETGKLNADIVTSGAFRVSNIDAQNGALTLERSENFWNKNQIQLERVRFVSIESAEKALEAYRAGELDAVTNADFAPLALKILTPFDDFRRTPHAALNFYEFNRQKPPFDDRRVREALTISVERERLTDDEMDGASIPALSFLPFETEKNLRLSQNVERAKNLLKGAGFASGEDFPVVKLVVNRNNLQQQIARAVAKMWKQNLKVDAQIVVKDQPELETARQTGDFDVVRRGVVLPTTDEAACMRAIFNQETYLTDAANDRKAAGEISTAEKPATLKSGKSAAAKSSETGEATLSESDGVSNQSGEILAATANASREISTENEAMSEFPAIPLYFPSSYALVKPYVKGFETNALDAPSLKDVRIENQ